MNTFKPKANPGDVIWILVDGKLYRTKIDHHGVQRFGRDALYGAMVDRGALDLNKLSLALLDGQFTRTEYRQFYLNIGYSVSGFCELEAFKNLMVENPLWMTTEADFIELTAKIKALVLAPSWKDAVNRDALCEFLGVPSKAKPQDSTEPSRAEIAMRIHASMMSDVLKNISPEKKENLPSVLKVSAAIAVQGADALLAELKRTEAKP